MDLRTPAAKWLERKRRERGRRALERQLAYQRTKVSPDAISEREKAHFHFLRSQLIRDRLEAIKSLSQTAQVLEVGSGTGGIIFGFGKGLRVGVDPLAVEYKSLFPKIQSLVNTVAAIGEELPFEDNQFDLVLSDNVIDHATRPLVIVDEMVRVLKPGGLLFFTVNVHHPIYHYASMAHGAWNALGLKLELSAFADHTVHMTEKRIADYFRKQPLNIIEQGSTALKARQLGRSSTSEKSLLKRVFFKNELFEVLAEKLG